MQFPLKSVIIILVRKAWAVEEVRRCRKDNDILKLEKLLRIMT